MNILLIGHEGYLGRGLLSYLSREHRVVGWDKKEDLFQLDASVLARENIEVLESRHHFRFGDRYVPTVRDTACPTDADQALLAALRVLRDAASGVRRIDTDTCHTH